MPLYSGPPRIALHQFGVVSRAIHKQTRKRWAIKSIRKKQVGSDNSRAGTNKFCRDIKSEVEIMFLLGGHDNVIQLHEVYEDEEAIHLVMVS